MIKLISTKIICYPVFMLNILKCKNFITKNKSLDISIASSINSQKKITDGNTVRSNENNNQGNVNSSFQKLQISNSENFNIQLKCYINFYFILNLLNKKTRIKI